MDKIEKSLFRATNTMNGFSQKMKKMSKNLFPRER